MKFKSLQDNLREVLWARIASGELTGLKLAKKAGFQQAHISNFLNRKRGLSLEGMDKILSVERLSVFDLLDREELDQRAGNAAWEDSKFASVNVVDAVNAVQPIITGMHVVSAQKYKKRFLQKLREELEGDRDHWERFLVIRADGREGMSMFPRLMPGAYVLLDRHYNSLKPYRRHDTNMYAVYKNGTCTLKYVEVAGSSLVLRPHNQTYPVEVMPLPNGKAASDYVIGRVCHLGIEA